MLSMLAESQPSPQRRKPRDPTDAPHGCHARSDCLSRWTEVEVHPAAVRRLRRRPRCPDPFGPQALEILPAIEGSSAVAPLMTAV